MLRIIIILNCGGFINFSDLAQTDRLSASSDHLGISGMFANVPAVVMKHELHN